LGIQSSDGLRGGFHRQQVRAHPGHGDSPFSALAGAPIAAPRAAAASADAAQLIGSLIIPGKKS